MGRKIDLTNQIFGDLIVIEDTGDRAKDGTVYWRCECACGNKNYIVNTTELRRKGSRAKTHCNNSIHSIIDLTGQHFGYLEVVKIDESSIGKRKIRWLCKCHKCNSDILVSIIGNDLKEGKSKSCGCGCSMSYGAQKILNILENTGLTIKKELSFEDLINPETNKKLKIDFGVYQNEKLLYLVEYDGEQHFYYQENKTSWNSKEKYEGVVKRDKIKNEYCLKNNILLYRIPYYDKDKVNSIQDICQNKYRVM